jgi:sterol desaturase/sphingolipid hydroxylase (fatty acid hydroxylase superfamily)
MKIVRFDWTFLIYPIIVFGGGTTIVLGINKGLTAWFIGLVLILSAICVAILERVIPYKKEWNNSKGDALTDVTHYIVNFVLKQLALMLYVFLVGHFAVLNTVWPQHIHSSLQVVIVLLVIDFFLYLVHRASHKNGVLWKLHAIHHSSERLYWINGEKRHPLHQILEGIPGITVIMLLGAPTHIVQAALSILGINMMLQHGNIDYRAGVLKYIFCVAEVHRWHHHKDVNKCGVNFGAFFAFWDHLFGSFKFTKETLKSDEVGIEGSSSPNQNYLKQLYYPFR